MFIFDPFKFLIRKLIFMQKILLGPAGIPVSCKKRGIIEGIKTVKELGLQAMEI